MSSGDWTGNGDGITWKSDANWSGASFPQTSSDVATINATADAITITGTLTCKEIKLLAGFTGSVTPDSAIQIGTTLGTDGVLQLEAGTWTDSGIIITIYGTGTVTSGNTHVSTGMWSFGGDGNISIPDLVNAVNKLAIGSGVTTTMIGNVFVKENLQGLGTIAGTSKTLSITAAINDFMGIGMTGTGNTLDVTVPNSATLTHVALNIGSATLKFDNDTDQWTVTFSAALVCGPFIFSSKSTTTTEGLAPVIAMGANDLTCTTMTLSSASATGEQFAVKITASTANITVSTDGIKTDSITNGRAFLENTGISQFLNNGDVDLSRITMNMTAGNFSFVGGTPTFKMAGEEVFTFLANGVTVTVLDDVICNTLLLVGAGVIDLNTNDVSATVKTTINQFLGSGSWHVAGPTGTGKITMTTSSAGVFNNNGFEIGNLTLDKSGGSINFAGDCDAVDFIVTAGTANFAANDKNLNVSGNFTNAGIFTKGTGTLTFDATTGTPTLTSGGDDLGNITISNSGVTSFVALDALDCDDFIINASGKFDRSTFAHNVGGNFTNAGTYLKGIGTLTFDATTGTLTWTTGLDDMGNVVISNPGVTSFTLQDVLTCTGFDLSDVTATWDSGGNNINVAGDVVIVGTRLGAGTWTISGTSNVSNTGNRFPTLTCAGTITANGLVRTSFLNITSGSFAIGVNEVNVSSDIVLTGGTTFTGIHNSGKVVLERTGGGQTVTTNAVVMPDIEVNQSGTADFIMGDDISCTNFIHTGGQEFRMNGNDLTSSGDLKIANLPNIFTSVGDFIMTGTGVYSNPNGTQFPAWPDLIITGTGVVTGGGNTGTYTLQAGGSHAVGGNIFSRGNIDISATGTLSGLTTWATRTTSGTLSNPAASNAIPDFTISNAVDAHTMTQNGDFHAVIFTIDSTCTLDRSTFDLNVGGTFLNSGTYTSGSGTLTFDASSGTPTWTTGGDNMGNVNINNAGVTSFFLQDSLDVDDFTITAGLFGQLTESMTCAGNFSVATSTYSFLTGATITFDSTSGTPTITTSSNDLPVLTVTNSGTTSLTLQDALRHQGFTMNAGSVFTQNGNLITTTFTFGAVTINATATLNSDATWTTDAGNCTFDNPTVGNAFSTLTMGDARQLILTGNVQCVNFIIASLSAYNDGANTLFVSGNHTNNGGVLFTTTGTVEFIGSGASTIDAVPFNKLVINKSTATVTLLGNITTKSDFTIQATATFDTSTFDLDVAGSFTNSGTFTKGIGLLTMNATSGTPTLDSGGDDLGLLTIDTTSVTLKLSGNTVSGNFNNLTSSSFDMNDFNLTIDGTFTNSTTGEFIKGTGLLKFVGASGTHNIFSGFDDLGNMEIDAAGSTYQTTQSLTVDNLTITAGIFLQGDPHPLNVNGSFTNLATYTAGTAALTFGSSSGVQTWTTGGDDMGVVIVNNSPTSFTLQDNLVMTSIDVQGTSLVDFNSKVMTASGSIIINSGATLENTGTWTMDASGNLSNPTVGNRLSSLTVSGAISVTCTGNTYLGDITLDTTGGDFDFGTFNIFTSGSFDNSADHGITPSTGKLTFDSTSGVRIFDPGVGDSFPNIDINNPGTTSLTLQQNFVCINFNLIGTSTFTDGGNDASQVTDLIISSTGTLNSTGTWTIFSPTADISNPTITNAFNKLKILGGTITGIGDVYCREYEGGTGTLATGVNTLFVDTPTVNDFFTTAISTNVTGSVDITITTSDIRTNGRFSISANILFSGTDQWGLTATDIWTTTGDFTFDSTVGTVLQVNAPTIDMDTIALTVGGDLIFSNASASGAQHVVDFDLGSGTHSITGDFKTASPTDGVAVIDFASSTTTVGGDIDLRRTVVTEGASTVDMTGISKTIFPSGGFSG